MSQILETASTKSFEYGIARIKDIAVRATKLQLPEGAKVRHKGRKSLIQAVSINGEDLIPTKRFWTSIQCRFGFSSNIFRYFDHAEVFNRISDCAPSDEVRYCIERDTKSNINRVLAVTNPRGGAMRFTNLVELLERYNAEKMSYADGVVRSTHKPKVGAAPMKVAGDEFANEFVIDTPIDGFGRPNIYLSLLRLICSNGAIGFGKAFRSEIATGKTDDDMGFALVRAMDGFNNEDGFAAMRQRFDAAAHSWASVNEVQKLYKTLMAQGSRGNLIKRGVEYVNGQAFETALPIFSAFDKMAGNLTQIYGLTNMDSLSIKRQRTLPAACKVYDLLNFATEVATHDSTANGNRSLQAYVGDLLACEYDLEGTVDAFSDWRDFFINNEETAKTIEAMRPRTI